MRFSNVCVEAVAQHLPDNVVTSEDLENRMRPLYERLKLPVGRLELMSGIRERRFWNEGVVPSEVGAIAGEKVLEKTGFDRSRIGCLISASVCRDFLEPATASVVHNKLQLPGNAEVLDISNACLGVLNGMVHVANMIELGHIEAGLVVAGENGGPLVHHTIETLLSKPMVTRKEIKSSFASLTIGSAAVGVLLTHKKISRTGHRLLGGVSFAASQFNDLCRGNDDSESTSGWSPLMETDAETLMREGCRLAGDTWNAFKTIMNWKNEDIDRVFCHQVGSMHRKLLYETIGMGLDKDFSTLEILGNTGAASLPVTLAMGEDKGFLPSGSKAALLGIGSGLNCLMLGVEW